MALASTPLSQVGRSALTPVFNPAGRDGLAASTVSSTPDVFALPKGRTGITCVNSPSTPGKRLELGSRHFVGADSQRGGRSRHRSSPPSVTRVAVTEAETLLSPIEVNTDAVAVLEAAYREPSFGLDDVLALSDELEVVGPPPDWTRQGNQSLVILPSLDSASSGVETDSIWRGLDDVFEMSGDLDIFGPSPDDTAGLHEGGLGRGQNRIPLDKSGLSAVRNPQVVDLSVGDSVFGQSADSGVSSSPREVDQSPERESDSMADSNRDRDLSRKTNRIRYLGKGLHPARKLAFKAKGLFPAKSVKGRVRQSGKMIMRRRLGGAESSLVRTRSPEVGADGLKDAPILKAIYEEGVQNIGSRVKRQGGSGKEGLAYIGDWNVLTMEEEVKLGLVIQRSKALLKQKEELEARSEAPLSEEEWAKVVGISVNALEKQIAAGTEARRRLIECNLRFVMFNARSVRHVPNALPTEDLFLAGLRGLIVAADNFDPTRGYRFVSYAVRVIRSHLSSAIQRSGVLIRLPSSRAMIRLNAARDELSVKLGRFPTPEELAAHENVSVDVVKDVMRWQGINVTFEVFAGAWDKYTRGDPDPRFATMEKEHLRLDLDSCISTLPAREGNVLRRRFGLGGHPSMTLREIGRELGISYELVRRYEARALVLMRKAQRIERLVHYRPLLESTKGR